MEELVNHKTLVHSSWKKKKEKETPEALLINIKYEDPEINKQGTEITNKKIL